MKPIYWLTLLSVLLPTKSNAHPMGSKPYSHRLRVQLHQEGLEVNYLAVIPERVLGQEMEESELNEKDFFQKKTEELQRGIGVFFDGVDYPVTASDQKSSLAVERGARSTAFEIQIRRATWDELRME